MKILFVALLLLGSLLHGETLSYNITYIADIDEGTTGYPRHLNNHGQVAFVRSTGPIYGQQNYIGIYSPVAVNNYPVGYSEYAQPQTGWSAGSVLVDFNDLGQVLITQSSPGNDPRWLLDQGTFRPLGYTFQLWVLALDENGLAYRDENGDWVLELKTFEEYIVSGDDRLAVLSLSNDGTIFGTAEYPGGVNESFPGEVHHARWAPGEELATKYYDVETAPPFDQANRYTAYNDSGYALYRSRLNAPSDEFFFHDGNTRTDIAWPDGSDLSDTNSYKINNSNEIAAFVNSPQRDLWIHLPAARDGYPEGLSLLDSANCLGDNVGEFFFNEQGDIYTFSSRVNQRTRSRLGAWKDGLWNDLVVTDPNVVNTAEFPTFGVTNLIDVNDNGELLVSVTRRDSSRWYAILTPAPLNVSFEVSEENIIVGDTVDLRVNVTNTSKQQINGIALIPSTIILTDTINLNWIAAPPSALNLAPGESGSLTYTFQSFAEGPVRIWGAPGGTVVGGDPINIPQQVSPFITVTNDPVRLSVELSNPPYRVGLPTTATVTLELLANEPATVTFPNGLLTSSQTEFADLIFEPVDSVELTPASPTQSFEIPVIARDFGSTTLTSTANYIYNDNTGSVSDTEEFAVDSLSVSLKALPLVDGAPIVNMKIDGTAQPGEPNIFDLDDNPVSPKVEITIENLSSEPLDVSLQGLDPRSRDDSAILGRISTNGIFPIHLGLVPGKSTVTREVDLQINQDGRFEFQALATAAVPGANLQYNVAAKGAPIAVGDIYPVELELEVIRTPVITNNNNGAAFIQPGGSLQVIAAIENLTTNSTLQFYGIKAKKTLNAFGSTITSDEGKITEPSFAHDHSVDAGASVVLSGIIRTDKDGAPSGIVEWQGLEDIKLIDDETGDVIELTMDDVIVKTTGANLTGWLGDPMAIRLIQDNSRSFAPPDLTVAEEVAIYSFGALNGVGQWTYDSFDAIGGIGRLAGNIVGDPDYLDNAMGQASRAVWEAAGLVANTWSEMTPEQKEEFVLSVVGEVARRSALLASGRAPFSPEEANAALEYTRNATFFLFDGVTDAYASDDPAQIAEMWGNVSGHVGMEVITAAISEIKFTKYVDGAEARRLLDNDQIGPALNDQESRLRTIKSGPISDDEVLKAFGPGPEDLRAFEQVFRAFGVKGYARERSPLSYGLINERGVAIWKPEAMKPKGISDIDLLLLGEPLPTLPGADGNPVNLQAITAIFWPEPDDVIRTRLSGQTPEMLEACLARAAKRRKEFQKYYPEFNSWDTDGIPVKRNYKDNGVPDPAGQGNPTRNFDYETILRGENTPPIFIPKMADSNGVLKYISGDIDWVHFSFLDGTPLDSKTARKLYDVLMDCCGLQHPETVTWINKGRSLFETKIDQIADYLRGEKALLEVSGEGPRAVRMFQNLTRFADGQDARNHLVFFDNGIKSRLRSTAADVETAFHNLRSRTPARLFTPFLWSVKNLDPETNTTIGDDDFLFDTIGSALLLRNNANDEIERFDGQNWVPFVNASPPSNISSEAVSSRASVTAPSPLTLTPTSGLTVETLAGSTILPIMDLPALWPTQLAGRVQNWFAPGQTIVIAPGEPSQETKTVLSINPLTITSPLSQDHPEDTIVAVLPADLTLAPPQSSLITTLEENGITTLVWSTLPNRQYLLEIQAGESWVSLGTPFVSDSNALATPLATSEYDSTATYRLQELGDAPAPLTITQFSFSPESGELTLQWATEIGQTYLVEASPDLTPSSWQASSNERLATSNLDQIVIPIGSELTNFYRVRSLNISQTNEMNILSFSRDINGSNITISWSTTPGSTYQVEHSHNDLSGFAPLGDAVTATGTSASLNLPVESNWEKAFFQVRKINP